MEMPRSTYYYQKTREQNQLKKQKADTDLADVIQRIQLEAPVYGTRRLYRVLLRKGLRVNKKKILRLQKEAFTIAIKAFNTQVRTT